MFGLALLFVYVFLLSFLYFDHCLAKRELVFVLIVHLFVSYAHVNLCRFFSSSWCQGLAATSACGYSWTFLFTFNIAENAKQMSIRKCLLIVNCVLYTCIS